MTSSVPAPPAGGPEDRRIDLNCDMGEIEAHLSDGTQESLLERVTSVNVACGAHAGDDAMMEATVRAARRRGRAIGAHPGYPDREHFGRRVLPMPLEEVARQVELQVSRLVAVARRLGAEVGHVKPHGALYNAAARDYLLAAAIARGVARVGRGFVLVGLAGSPCLEAYAAAGFRVAAEAFADRRYQPDGSLRSRDLAGALLTDPQDAAAQALRIARDRCVLAHDGARLAIEAETLCLHGDTPGAPRIAAAVAETLAGAGFALRSLSA